MELSVHSCLLLLVSCLALCQATLINVKQYEDYSDYKKLMEILSKPRVLDRYTNEGKNMVKGVQWRNCGSASDPLQIHSFSLSPDPVRIPGMINASLSVSSTVDLTDPIKVELEVKKKIIFWIGIPCVDNVGSCTYDDICSMLTSIQQCPPEVVKLGLTCKCPFKKGSYQVPSTTITIPPVNLPTWLEDGDYQVTAKLSSKGKSLGCVFAQLSLTKGSSKKRFHNYL